VTFTNIVASADDDPPAASQHTMFFVPVDLAEDTRYCWRVRSDDGQATSVYNVACFLVSERNDPPSVPALGEPDDQMVIDSVTPVFSWAPSTDPEGNAIMYQLEVRHGDEVIGEVAGISGTVTAIGTQLTDGETYRWRMRATDAEGLSSAWSDEASFRVALAVDPHDTCCDSDGGCRTSTRGDGGTLVGTGLGLALIALRRRRRR
jgi:hypothetical protein